MKNPKFKNYMITKKLLNACERQLHKYFGDREMDQNCDICDAIDTDCIHCPLGDGIIDWNDGHPPCVKDSSFINPKNRVDADEELLISRGDRLIEILDENGIQIYEKEFK